MGGNYKLSVEANHEGALFIRESLVQYKKEYISEAYTSPSEDVHIFLRDQNEAIIGGLTGSIKLKCLCVDIFWLDEKLRGMGKGSEILAFAEKYANEKECTLVKLDTFSFQAPDFYTKQGYEIYGELENFPEEGITHYYLFKRLGGK
ncbi:hypothetical protein AM500_13995 [Bacillus sp. FJAT-18017]|uniref:GNAT family N-acetyltransferase n=1 Tax=Bacillus sp. FJAT-18017 TaxID=1705566 RepID=UPI0006ADE4F5|nr:GNAT family N-acetyltransferase [Bacillus sp. FJAT-18017]ALC90775.1 hypothetical protein AM500_13995 [Bacillus sp. FJAT-18017]